MKPFLILSSISEHKIRVFGRDWPELCIHALQGMFETIEPQQLDQQIIERPFDVEALDRESLLVSFLSEALYLSAVHHEAYNNAHFETLSASHASGYICGFKISGFSACEIKAVTHHGMHIEKINNRLQTDILFDV